MRKMKPSDLWETDHIMGGAFYDHPDDLEPNGVPGSEYLKLLETREDVLIFRDVDCDGDMWLRVFVIGKSDKERVAKSLNNWRHPKFALWEPRIHAWQRVYFDKMTPDFFKHKGIK